MVKTLQIAKVEETKIAKMKVRENYVRENFPRDFPRTFPERFSMIFSDDSSDIFSGFSTPALPGSGVEIPKIVRDIFEEFSEQFPGGFLRGKYSNEFTLKSFGNSSENSKICSGFFSPNFFDKKC